MEDLEIKEKLLEVKSKVDFSLSELKYLKEKNELDKLDRIIIDYLIELLDSSLNILKKL